MKTIHKGKIAPMMAPKPLLTYFTPQVLRPLLKTKLRMLRMKIAFHCFPFGQDAFLYTKKATKSIPAINCLMPASCKAGMCFTPSFEAIQVVPQKKLIQHKAKMGNPMVLIRDKKAFFILVFTGLISIFGLKKIFSKVSISELNFDAIEAKYGTFSVQHTFNLSGLGKDKQDLESWKEIVVLV